MVKQYNFKTQTRTTKENIKKVKDIMSTDVLVVGDFATVSDVIGFMKKRKLDR